jgi:hypothetical protein
MIIFYKFRDAIKIYAQQKRKRLNKIERYKVDWNKNERYEV